MTFSLWALCFRRYSMLPSAMRSCARRNNVKISSRRFQSTTGESTTSDNSRFYLRARRNSLFSPFMILVGIVPVFTFALGTWQVQRLKWKVNLIDELQEKLERDPILLPKHVNLTAIPEFVYRKVLLRGRWDHEHAILVGPRVYDGQNGYHLIEPLIRQDGSTILVDRGFVTKDHVGTVHELKDIGEVEVLGMLRTGHVRNRFTPDNHPEKGEWYWVDTEAMAEHAGGAKAGVQPVFVEEIFEGHAGQASSRIARGMPVGRPATVDVRNSHLSYIVTWYSLSAFTTVMFFRLLLKRRRAHTRLPR